MRNPFKRIFFLFILPVLSISFLISSCKKNDIEINFSEVNSGTTEDIFKIKKFDAKTFYLCGGRDKSGFIMKSNDAGITWHILQDAFPEKIFDLDFINDKKMIAVGALITFYRTADDWKSWQFITPSPTEYPKTGYDSNLFSIDMVNDSIGYACGGKVYQQGVIYRTDDGGSNWHYTYREHEMRSVVMLDEQQGYAAGYGVIYKTDDSGMNWTVTDASDDFFTCMTQADPRHIFAGGYEGSILDINNYSDSWNKNRGGNIPFGKRIHFNCIDFYNAGIGAAAGAGGIICITRNGGNNWSAGSAFNEAQIKSIVLTSENSGFAAAAKGKLFKFQF